MKILVAIDFSAVTERIMDVVKRILEQAGKRCAELLVIGSHGHGAMFDLLFGSISEGIVRRSTLPVLVVPSRVPE